MVIALDLVNFECVSKLSSVLTGQYFPCFSFDENSSFNEVVFLVTGLYSAFAGGLYSVKNFQNFNRFILGKFRFSTIFDL